MAAPEANFLVLLFWVAMAALLIVLIAMGKDHYRRKPDAWSSR